MQQFINKWRQGFFLLSITAGMLAMAPIEQASWHGDSLGTPVSSQPVAATSKHVHSASKAQTYFGSLQIGQSRAVVRKLFESMQDDEFASGKPFQRLSTYQPFEKLSQMDISSFDRQTSRTSNYQKSIGYDLVRYIVHLKSGMDATVMAYRKKTSPDQVTLGDIDDRPTFVMLSLPSESSSQVFVYKMGDLKTQVKMSLQDAQNMVQARMQSAMTLMFASVND